MNNNFDTVRVGLAVAIDAEEFVDKPVRKALLQALTALTAIEAENAKLREALKEIADNTDDPTAEAVARTALEHKL